MFALSAGLLLHGVTASYQVLAAEDVCFNAQTIDTNTLFNAPEDGEIKGIYLVHKSGGVRCHAGPFYNWGCWAGHHMTFLLRDNDTVNPAEILYPRVDLGTLDVVDTGHGCNTPCGVGAGGSIYHQVPNVHSNQNNLTLIEPLWDVTTAQVFRLVYGEACCQQSTSNNAGTSCADVYFIYTTEAPSKSPTRAPSLATDAPSKMPSAAPSKTPTTAPSKMPTSAPSKTPTTAPSKTPTAAPSKTPTTAPSKMPSAAPSKTPTTAPSKMPTSAPSKTPTAAPSKTPTVAPSKMPTSPPSNAPTKAPSRVPTGAPTSYPTGGPTLAPTNAPTKDSEDDSYEYSTESTDEDDSEEYSMESNDMDAAAMQPVHTMDGDTFVGKHVYFDISVQNRTAKNVFAMILIMVVSNIVMYFLFCRTKKQSDLF